MYLKPATDSFLAAVLISLSAMCLALTRPITIDLEVYSVWLMDPDVYQFDPGFVFFGQVLRLFTDNIRFLIFCVSLLLQIAVIRACLIFYPSASPALMALIGATAYWHVSLSSNVVRNGLAVAVALFILTSPIATRRIRFALAFFAGILIHWASFAYFFVLWLGKRGQQLRPLHLFLLICVAAATVYLGFQFFDFSGKLLVYGSTEVFTSERSSQTPRLIAQLALIMGALYYRLCSPILGIGLRISLVILFLLSPFPEAFSRISVLTGILLHIIYVGWFTGTRHISGPLKLVVAIAVLLGQLLHPSTATLLGIR